MKMEECLSLLEEKIAETSVREVAEALGVVPGTVNRWILLKDIPRQYFFDLCDLCQIDIEYEKFSHREKDQFFTPHETAEKCMNIFITKMRNLGEDTTKFTYIEPSVGSGVFWNLFPEQRRIALDIEPKIPEAIKQNYLTWKPQESDDCKYVVIGNPPFGLRGNLALRFINHSAEFSEYVAFILPQFFDSDGRGTPKKRIKKLCLIHSEVIKTNFQYPDGKDVKVNVIFQIWSKNKKQETSKEKKCDKFINIYSLSDGGTPGTTRNKKWLDKCDYYLPSTCFGKNNMKAVKSFEELPGRKGYGIVLIDKTEPFRDFIENIVWNEIAFLSTNSAFNLRKSLIVKHLTDNGFYDTENDEMEEAC